MRDAALFGARLLLGGYMGIHASQKLALTLAAAGPGKYKLGPSLPGKLAAFGFLAGGAAAGALIAKMVTSKPAPAEVAAEPPVVDA